jgi:hypothetical protein
LAGQSIQFFFRKSATRLIYGFRKIHSFLPGDQLTIVLYRHVTPFNYEPDRWPLTTSHCPLFNHSPFGSLDKVDQQRHILT